MILSRRDAILGASAATLMMPQTAFAAGVTRHFDAYRGRKKFGAQALAVKQDGSNLVVDTHTRLKGRVVIFNFDYEIKSREIWRDGVLQAINATAREGDKTFAVKAKRTSAGLEVDATKFKGVVTGSLTTSSIIMADLAKRPKWLSIQSGRVVEVTSQSKGSAKVETPAGTVTCEHIYCAGGLKLPLDAFFAESGELVAYEFDAVGARARVIARSTAEPYHQLWR